MNEWEAKEDLRNRELVDALEHFERERNAERGWEEAAVADAARRAAEEEAAVLRERLSQLEALGQ
eukprot:gene26072-31931_t